MEYRIENLQELDEWTKDFVNNLSQKKQANIVSLKGDLGAGKTALVKSCAQHLGIKQDITSPTFVIQKEYDLVGDDRFKKMIHIDAYRLESASELEYLKWNELIEDQHNLIFIEWPQMVEGVAMPDTIEIELSILENQERSIIIRS